MLLIMSSKPRFEKAAHQSSIPRESQISIDVSEGYLLHPCGNRKTIRPNTFDEN